MDPVATPAPAPAPAPAAAAADDAPPRVHRLDFPALERCIEGRSDETVYAAARRAGLRLVGACGGRGSCGSCVVHVHAGSVARDGEPARRRWQRACRLRPRSDLVLELSPRALAPVLRTDVRTGGEGVALPLQPAVAPAPAGRPWLGLAVDLGTTNAAGFLVDLHSGRPLARLGIENPQAAWGADLVTRLNHATRSAEAAAALRRAATGAIDALAHELARAVGARGEHIADIAVCGNTAMQHLLMGWPVAALARAPFVAHTPAAQDLAAADAGLAAAPAARLHLAPTIGGFVGGDHVAALLATEPLWSAPGSTLVMDIGTHTEISLVHPGGITCASCPSGPALEGGQLGCGMRAAEGAVERVAVRGARLALQVIGGGRPLGLCGSGVIDALAALVHAGWIDRRGRIGHGPAATEGGDGRAITLAAATPRTPALRLTQHDVRAVQLAKSAIRTGVRLLCAEAGLDEGAITRFVVAGAFGSHVDLGSAVAIGLLPALPRERFVQVGNAAGLGVQQMLASTARRARAAALALQARHLELSTRPDFQKTFLQQIGFPAP